MSVDTTSFLSTTQAPCSLTSLASSCFKNRRLVYQLAKREVLSRYKSSVLGLAWSIVNPLLMLAIYTYVFSEIFKARWSGSEPSDSKVQFALILFVGLTVYSFFSEVLNRAPTSIAANVNYVKKVIFPLELLPIISALVSLFHALISFIILIIVSAVLLGKINATVLWLPFVFAPFFLLVIGISFFLSALGVYVRDTAQVTSSITAVLMFLSPVFYPIEAVPAAFRPLLLANPLTMVIEQARMLLIWGKSPDLYLLTIYWFSSVFLLWIGYVFFQKTRKGFADVL